MLIIVLLGRYNYTARKFLTLIERKGGAVLQGGSDMDITEHVRETSYNFLELLDS